jgi:hypothetical protein
MKILMQKINNFSLIFIILIISIIFVTFYSGQKIAEQKQIKNDIFIKKQECIKYEEYIENKLKKNTQDYIGLMENKIIQIFYSPIKKSCLVAYENKEHITAYDEESGSYRKTFIGLIIDDILTGENYFITGFWLGEKEDANFDFKKEIEKLKF